MMLILHAFQVALAADVSTYGRVGAVELPASGVVRIALPPDLVAGEVENLDRGLLVTDGTGREVPYAVLRSSAGGPTESVELDFRPVDGAAWESDAAEAPVDALVLDVLDLEGLGPFRASVSWWTGSGWEAGESSLLYDVGDEESRTIEVPHVRGPFRLALTGFDARRPRLVDVTATRNAPDHVPPNVEAVPMPTPVITEDGRARYTLRLGGVRTVRGLRFELPPEVDVLDREVTIRSLASDPYDYGSSGSGRIRRLKVGAANVDRMEVRLDGVVGDTLVVEIPLDRGAPLPLDEVDVISEGAWLVVRDAGPAPHAVYGAATLPDSAYDLAVALPELLRDAPPVVEVGSAGPNPAFVPVPTREEVDLPGPDLGLARFRYERDLQGAGWVRVALDRDVLARTRTDLGDVRVVDAAGRQIPFLLWNTGDEEPWEAGAFERTEEGSATLIRVPLDGDAPVSSVRLETSRAVFERPVTVLRDAGRTTIALRRVVWSGPERGGTLAVAIGERLGGALLVRIENDDDAPIPIDAVRVYSPRWELRARVPEGAARLVYGNPAAERPEYDLRLLEDEVRGMVVTDGTLGEERSLEPPTASAVDRGATVAGVALLAVGLLGMVARVLKGVPASS